MWEEKNRQNEFETVFIREEIEKCETLEELKEYIFPMVHTQQEEWARKVNEMIEEGGFTKSGFAKLCGVSRVTVDKWCKGSVPKNREKFIRIGMVVVVKHFCNTFDC